MILVDQYEEIRDLKALHARDVDTLRQEAAAYQQGNGSTLDAIRDTQESHTVTLKAVRSRVEANTQAVDRLAAKTDEENQKRVDEGRFTL